jgi:hypothetical protein
MDMCIHSLGVNGVLFVPIVADYKEFAFSNSSARHAWLVVAAGSTTGLMYKNKHVFHTSGA